MFICFVARSTPFSYTDCLNTPAQAVIRNCDSVYLRAAKEVVSDVWLKKHRVALCSIPMN